jgi:hypothetical protein
MFTKIRRRHVIATALALVGGYSALITAEAPREQELPASELREAIPAPAVLLSPPPTGASHSLLSDLSARLSELEAQLTAPAKAVPAHAEAPQPEQASGPEPALAEWMLAAIRGEEWDRDHTQKVEAELSATLERSPELHAQELECGKRFCRALLIDRRGDDVELQPLFGAPPFDGEGFTTLGQGGKAEVYFTRAGQSLDALRKEAQL